MQPGTRPPEISSAQAWVVRTGDRDTGLHAGDSPTGCGGRRGRTGHAVHTGSMPELDVPEPAMSLWPLRTCLARPTMRTSSTALFQDSPRLQFLFGAP